jgi:hypothetical protein
MKLLSACVVAGMVAVVGCSAAPDDETGPSGSDSAEIKKCKASSAFAGEELTANDVAGYLRQAGFKESEVAKMVCIAKYESRFFTQAHRLNTNCTNDIGLFQVNDYWWAESCGVKPDDLYDPATNAACAKMVRDNDPNHFRAWYGYRSHVAECDSFRLPK